MRKRLQLFIILTLINGLIFLFRGHFTFVPAVDYNFLYKKNQDHSLKKWNEFVEYYPPDDLLEARRISSQWFKESYVTTIDSVLIIAEKVYNDLCQQTGRPSVYLEQLTPINKYNKLLNDTTEKLWCGTFSQIFNFFCIANKIPSRYIEIKKPGDHHVVNEVFLASSKKWVLMDISSYIIAPKSSDGRFLNFIDFASELRNGRCALTHSNKAEKICKTHPVILKYYLPNVDYYYHLHIDNDKAYSIKNKVLRYIFPQTWYYVYSEKSITNSWFAIKVVLFYIWLGIACYLIYTYFIFLLTINK
jgi:hypothetical protein